MVQDNKQARQSKDKSTTHGVPHGPEGMEDHAPQLISPGSFSSVSQSRRSVGDMLQLLLTLDYLSCSPEVMQAAKQVLAPDSATQWSAISRMPPCELACVSCYLKQFVLLQAILTCMKHAFNCSIHEQKTACCCTHYFFASRLSQGTVLGWRMARACKHSTIRIVSQHWLPLMFDYN